MSRSLLVAGLLLAATPLLPAKAMAQTGEISTPTIAPTTGTPQPSGTAGSGTPKTFPPTSDCAALEPGAKTTCENRRQRAAKESQNYNPALDASGAGGGTAPGTSSDGSINGLPSESGAGTSMGTRNTLNNSSVPSTGRASDPDTVGNPNAGTPNESGTGIFTAPGASAPQGGSSGGSSGMGGSSTGGSSLGGSGSSSGTGGSSGGSSGGGSSGGGSSGGGSSGGGSGGGG